jgi:hypothetical protein
VKGLPQSHRQAAVAATLQNYLCTVMDIVDCRASYPSALEFGIPGSACGADDECYEIRLHSVFIISIRASL